MPPYKIAFFDTKQYDTDSFTLALDRLPQKSDLNIHYLESRLSKTICDSAQGCHAICAFVNDDLGREVIEQLAKEGVKAVLMRCAGFDRVDLVACKEYGISVMRVPAYSPYAVAEFAITSFLTLNRKTHRSFDRVRHHDFSLSGLVGFDLHEKTVGVIGTGKIGQCFIDIVLGFGCHVVAYDVYPNDRVRSLPNTKYVELDELFANSDVISLHAPLTHDNYHLINRETISRIKKGAYVINSSRGGLIDAEALIEGLESGQLGGASLDVYEHEADYFFRDCSGEEVKDPVLARLCKMHNVLLSSHQAFLTQEALNSIATTTLFNATEFLIEGKKFEQLRNYVPPPA